MDVHQNASLTPRGREQLVRRVLYEGETPRAVARALGVCEKTVRKWVVRYREESVAGLKDRTSRPHRSPNRTPAPVEEHVVTLRRQRRTGKQIAAETGVSPATVSRILRRHGLSRLRDLAPAEPVRRYERDRPGELIHLDIKKLGRFARTGHRITGFRQGMPRSRGIGWKFLHVCIDDASRVAYVDLLPDERKESAWPFWKLRSAIMPASASASIA